MPLRQYDTNIHKALLINIINLVKLRDSLPLWQSKPLMGELMTVRFLTPTHSLGGVKKRFFEMD
jgi:hypothetical protein